MKKIIFAIFLASYWHVQLMAQSNDVVMADQFRSDGKIYVVVAVLCIIMSGLFLYLFSLDKKINKLEKELDNNTTPK